MAGRTSPIKKRSQEAYNKKVARITAWYERLVLLRDKEAKENPNTKAPNKRKELKDLNFYISQIKKVSN
jgi:hypothetical protein